MHRYRSPVHHKGGVELHPGHRAGCREHQREGSENTGCLDPHLRRKRTAGWASRGRGSKTECAATQAAATADPLFDRLPMCMCDSGGHFESRQLDPVLLLPGRSAAVQTCCLKAVQSRALQVPACCAGRRASVAYLVSQAHVSCRAGSRQCFSRDRVCDMKNVCGVKRIGHALVKRGCKLPANRQQRRKRKKGCRGWSAGTRCSSSPTSHGLPPAKRQLHATANVHIAARAGTAK